MLKHSSFLLNIKLLFCFLFFIALTCAKYNEDMQKCMKEQGLTMEKLRELSISADENDESAIATLGCLQTCLLEKQGTLKDGKLSVADFRPLAQRIELTKGISIDETMQKFQDCADAVGKISDKCMQGAAFMKCIAFVKNIMNGQ